MLSELVGSDGGLEVCDMVGERLGGLVGDGWINILIKYTFKSASEAI